MLPSWSELSKVRKGGGGGGERQWYPNRDRDIENKISDDWICIRIANMLT